MPSAACQSGTMLMKQSVTLFALCSALCGCGKKQAPPVQPTPEQSAQIESEYILPANTPVAAPAAKPRPGQLPPSSGPRAQQVVVPIQQRTNGAVHAKLPVQLQMYMEKNGGRIPDIFSEFAFRNLDTVPPVPEGMKFVIDPVDKAVKVVKKEP